MGETLCFVGLVTMSKAFMQMAPSVRLTPDPDLPPRLKVNVFPPYIYIYIYIYVYIYIYTHTHHNCTNSVLQQQKQIDKR
jgi:hypothetical protein